jgi:hypothetical protein
MNIFSNTDLDPQQPTVVPSSMRRRLTNQFVEIDETEYSKVSDFVKQRVKLSEVNVVSL